MDNEFLPSSRQRGQMPVLKGCSCKRSQCIKNYCDCYQSIQICSVYCKCIDCRNTEERNVSNLPPAKNSKRERGAALTAKAAAAAARAGITVPKSSKPSPATIGSPTPVVHGIQLPYGYMAAAQPQVMNIVPMGNTMTTPQMVVQSMPQLPTVATTAPGGVPVVAAVAKPVKPYMPVVVPPLDPKNINIFSQPINSALMECMVLQAKEAGSIGLTWIQAAKLVILELAMGISGIDNALNTT